MAFRRVRGPAISLARPGRNTVRRWDGGIRITSGSSDDASGWSRSRQEKLTPRERLDMVKQKSEEMKARVSKHEMYKGLTTKKNVQLFMEHHVFSVWDFMSIVKSLQHHICPSNQVPWIPPENADMAQMMNEIIMSEESDAFEGLHEALGIHTCSHYMMYIKAMEQIGADTTAIVKLVKNIRKGEKDMWKGVEVDPTVQEYVDWTLEMSTLDTPIHIVMGNLLFGRENVIPPMFTEALIHMLADPSTDGLKIYMERHIEVDGAQENNHAVLAEKMLMDICGDDEQMWKDVEKVAIKGLSNRKKMWDSVCRRWEKEARFVLRGSASQLFRGRITSAM